MLPLHNTAICLSLWAVQCFLRFPQRLILYQIHSQLSIGFLKKVENFAAQGLPYPFPASDSGAGADTACVIVARYASIGVRPHITRVVCRYSGNTACSRAKNHIFALFSTKTRWIVRPQSDMAASDCTSTNSCRTSATPFSVIRMTVPPFKRESQ